MATRTVAESREERKRELEAAKEAMQEAASYGGAGTGGGTRPVRPGQRPCEAVGDAAVPGRASPSPTAPCTVEGWEQGKSSPPTRRRPLRRTAKATLPRGPLRAQPCPPGF